VVRVNIKSVFPTYKTLKDGTRRTYWFHRETGKRLHDEPGSPEFIADLAAAEKLIRDRLAGTFNNLIRLFTLSVEFDSLQPSTKIEYRRMLTKAEGEFGDMPTAALDDPRVRRDFLDWREKVARAPGEREADNRLSAISAMLTWAVDRGDVAANHLRGFKRLYHADRSEIIWLPEHIEAFMGAGPLEVQQAMILGLHTRQRQGDLLRLPWSAYDGQTLFALSFRSNCRAPVKLSQRHKILNREFEKMMEARLQQLECQMIPRSCGKQGARPASAQPSWRRSGPLF
jgi:hypothetical protein